MADVQFVLADLLLIVVTHAVENLLLTFIQQLNNA
jgi:hypothetical protein